MVSRLTILLLAALLFTVSCQKEFLCDFCASTDNLPPVANAGIPVTITLPTDSTQLIGSASEDPDGMIVGYQWRKIQGPPGETISLPQDSNTFVNQLTEGIYLFELMVTDDGGLSDKDSVSVTVIHPDSIYAPIACAGTDTIIVLPVNHVLLDGSCTTDPDDNIIRYQWAKISGPASYNFVNPSAAQTVVNDLEEGIYLFRLTVTDQDAQSSWDEIFVEVVNGDTCTQYPPYSRTPNAVRVGVLSNNRDNPSVIVAGGKIFFAGGGRGVVDGASNRVDIYDIAQNTWTIDSLSQARFGVATATQGNKVYFAGGNTLNIDSTDQFYSTIDVYDFTNGNWTVEQLSAPGSASIGISKGNKVMFAGGLNRPNRLDIYDATTNTWSIKTLIYGYLGSPTITNSHIYPSLNNSIYFVNGYQLTNWAFSVGCEIYDIASGTLSIAPDLIYNKQSASVLTVNNNIYIGGGHVDYELVCNLEIRNMQTGTSTLSDIGLYLKASAAIQDKIIYSDGHAFTIFNTNYQTWQKGQFPFQNMAHSFVNAGNYLYVIVESAGDLPDEIWRLDF